MKQLEVHIMGQSYLLGCPEGGDARLLEAVRRVDAGMCKIREVGKVRSRERIAVLAALNLAFDLSDRLTPAPPAGVATLGQDSDPSQLPAADQSGVLTALLNRLDSALGKDDRLG